MDCGGSELSDGGSSGYWSVGHGAGSPEPAVSPATPPDEGLDMEMEQVLFDEPAARKRRVRMFYSCFTGSILTFSFICRYGSGCFTEQNRQSVVKTAGVTFQGVEQGEACLASSQPSSF